MKNQRKILGKSAWKKSCWIQKSHTQKAGTLKILTGKLLLQTRRHACQLPCIHPGTARFRAADPRDKPSRAGISLGHLRTGSGSVIHHDRLRDEAGESCQELTILTRMGKKNKIKKKEEESICRRFRRLPVSDVVAADSLMRTTCNIYSHLVSGCLAIQGSTKNVTY